MTPNLLTLTADIVAAHAGHNEVAVDALPAIVQAVYRALATVDSPAASAPTKAQEPAVPIRRSVFPDYIVCLEDGKKLTMLKRYLHVRYGMTPNDYRQKWGLPPDYPMAAPNFIQQRSTLAKSFGLVRRASKMADTLEEMSANEPVITTMPARRARGYKG